MVKVLVLDDGDVGRLGRSTALEAAGHEVRAFRWSEVDDRLEGAATSLTGVEVVVAALRPRPASWDRYAVLATASRLTTALGGEVPTIGLLWGEAAVSPLLGLRLERAGVERLADAAEMGSIVALDGLVADGAGSRPSRPSSECLSLHGVARDTDPDAVVAWVAERLAGPQGDAYARAFDPSCTQNACGLTRRQAHTLRVKLSALGRIRSSPSYGGGGPVCDRSLPRWSEVVAVANLCRGWHGHEELGAVGTTGAIDGPAGSIRSAGPDGGAASADRDDGIRRVA